MRVASRLMRKIAIGPSPRLKNAVVSFGARNDEGFHLRKEHFLGLTMNDSSKLGA